MKIEELLNIYAKSPQVGALAETLGKKSVKHVFLEGLMCSSAPMVFASLSQTLAKRAKLTAATPYSQKANCMLFMLQDAEEAGYFYHDLVHLLDDKQVLFFPSSYRRAVKYGQRDAASEILRTEVLAKLSANSQELGANSLLIVTHPEAVAELVTSKRVLDDKMIALHQGETIDVDKTVESLRQLGFQ